MFDNLRARIAASLLPDSHKQQAIHPYRLLSFYQPDMPVYPDMTVRKATREGYKISVYVYRAVRTIVSAASGIPWIVLNKDGEEIPEHPFTQRWAKPNSEFSGQDNMEFIIAHLKLIGNALVQPLIIGGQPREFWVCMPDMIKPLPSDKKGEWLKGWQIIDASGNQSTAPPEQFIHFMQFDPGNPYWGIGDLQAAARTVDTDNEAQDTQKVQLQNRNVPPGLFEFESNLSDEQWEEAQRRVREKFLEKSKRGEPWVVGGGYKWQQMSFTPVEMDYIASRLQNLRAIASAFGLDPWHLGDREHSTYNNVIEARRALYEDAVIPLLDDIRSTLNLRVAPLYGDDIYITYDLTNISAMRDDFGKRLDQAKNLWAMGVPFDQINTKLELGFEEFEGWDVGYLPMNLLPTGSTPSEAEAPKMLTKALNLINEEQKSIHWKRIDRRRVAWWGVIGRKIKPLYDAELKVVEKTIKDKAPDKIEKAAKDAIQGQRKEWENIIMAAAASIVEDFGNEIVDDLGGQPKSVFPSESKWSFEPFSSVTRAWIAKHAAENVKSIMATNLDDVRSVILKGIDEGLTTPQIGSKIRQFYSDHSTYKAYRIARTEVAQAAGFGQREAARQSGVVKTKTWLTSRDDRVRDEHMALEGKTVPFNESYPNGEMYPGENSINCRCVESYGTE